MPCLVHPVCFLRYRGSGCCTGCIDRGGYDSENDDDDGGYESNPTKHRAAVTRLYSRTAPG